MVNKKAFDEVLRRPEIKQALKDIRVSDELLLVDKLMHEIAKQGKVSYGMKETLDAVNQGAVEHLLVSKNLIEDLREKDDFEKLDRLMKTAEQMKAQITIIGKNDAGSRLDGIGGLGALLRYKILNN